MIKSIIKRVLVFVIGSLLLAFISKYLLFTNVYAMEVYSANMTGQNSNRFVVSNTDTSISYEFNPIFHDVALGKSGYIRIPISVVKSTGSSTAPNVTIRGVTIKIGDTNYLCEVGTSSINNSTFNSTSYSVMCPAKMTGGLHQVYVAFNDIQSNDTSLYRVTIGLGASFEVVNDSNFDTSNITSSIGTQISNDNQNTQAIINSQNNTTSAINDVNDTLNDDDVTAATDTASTWIDNIEIEDHGLSTLVTSPLRLIQSFTTATCNPLSFKLPFVENNVVLPCYKSIIQQNFGVFFSLYQLITTGLIAYRVWINYLCLVHNLQDPFYSRIAVINL